MKKLLLAFLLLAGLASAQIVNQPANRIRSGGSLPGTCNDGQVFFVTGTGMYQCITGMWQQIPTSISGTGTVTSVEIAGTAGQITATGTCTVTTAGTCTLSLPSDVALPGTINSLTLTTSTGTFTLTNAKTFKVDKTLELDGTDGVKITFPATDLSLINPVFNTVVGQPATAVTALIGRVTSGGSEYGIEVQNKANNSHIAGINGTGLFDGTMAVGGLTGLGSNVSTLLITPSSANLAAAITDETGSGALVFGTAPTITLANGTGLPISTGVSGLGTGIATWLATPSGANLASALTTSLPASKGGTGIANTATLTLGSSNQNWATLGTGIVKNTTTTGALSNAASTDVIGLFNSGTCSGYLKSDGSCDTPSAGSTTAALIKAALIATDATNTNNYVACDANSTAPVDGLLIILKVAHDNTGGSTYNHCSAGALPIQTSYGAAMLAGQIRADGTGSPSHIQLAYSAAANGGSGAWQLQTPGQVQLAPQVAANFGTFPRADGNGLTGWYNPTNPGDGRKIALQMSDGRHWDMSNGSQGIGATFSYGGTSGFAGSASIGSGTQFPYSTLTTKAASPTSGDNVYFNQYADDLGFRSDRNYKFDTKVTISATTSIRNWIVFTGDTAGNIALSATPTTSGVVGFRYGTGTGDTTYQCVMANATASTITDSGVAPSTNQTRFRVFIDNANSAVHYYIDDTEVCTGSSFANLPASTYMQFAVTATTLTSATRALSVAYQWIQGDK